MNLILTRNAARAGLLAGLFLLTHYAVQLAYGFRTGENLFPNTEFFVARIDFLLFLSAWGLTGWALLALRGFLPERMKKLGAAVAALATAGVAASVAAMLILLFVPNISGPAETLLAVSGPVNVLSQFSAAVLLGAGFLRARTLPRWIPTLVLLFGVTTAPLALAAGAFFGPSLPEYTWAELHFAWTGVLWIAIGFGLLRLYYDTEEKQAVRPVAVPVVKPVRPAGIARCPRHAVLLDRADRLSREVSSERAAPLHGHPAFRNVSQVSLRRQHVRQGQESES